MTDGEEAVSKRSHDGSCYLFSDLLSLKDGRDVSNAVL